MANSDLNAKLGNRLKSGNGFLRSASGRFRMAILLAIAMTLAALVCFLTT